MRGTVETRTVGQVAELAGITVRALHHWDEIGLLSPSGRTSSGYRRYDGDDLDRLQRILFYRELGFPLDQIAVLLDEPGADPDADLRRQHELLTARIRRLESMAAAVERAMEARTMGLDLTPEEKFEVFGDTDPEQYDVEVRERWGNTDAYTQSAQRTATYTKADWLEITAEGEDLNRRLGEAFRAGAAADSERAMDLAEEHRQHIDRRFYDCSREMHGCLGEMFAADERFAANYEKIAPGLAQWWRDAVLANAGR